MKDIKLINNIELVNIDSIEEYINNVKKHPKEQIDKLAKSIAEYGFTVPIIIDKDNKIIAGHGRFKAGQQLGLKEVPIIKREDLSDTQVKAFRLADNKTAESNWDLEALSIELEELDFEDIDLSLMTGFDEIEIDSLLNADDEFSFNVNNVNDDKKGDVLNKDPDDMQMVEGEKPNQAYVINISFSSLDGARYFLENIGQKEVADRFKGDTTKVSIGGDAIRL